MNQRLTACNRYDRRPAFVDCLHALLDAQTFIQDLIGVIDLAAARAGQIAAEQRLEHQHQRIALTPSQLLADQVAADVKLLKKRNAQCYRLLVMFKMAKPNVGIVV